MSGLFHKRMQTLNFKQTRPDPSTGIVISYDQTSVGHGGGGGRYQHNSNVNESNAPRRSTLQPPGLFDQTKLLKTNSSENKDQLLMPVPLKEAKNHDHQFSSSKLKVDKFQLKLTKKLESRGSLITRAQRNTQQQRSLSRGQPGNIRVSRMDDVKSSSLAKSQADGVSMPKVR